MAAFGGASGVIGTFPSTASDTLAGFFVGEKDTGSHIYRFVGWHTGDDPTRLVVIGIGSISIVDAVASFPVALATGFAADRRTWLGLFIVASYPGEAGRVRVDRLAVLTINVGGSMSDTALVVVLGGGAGCQAIRAC